MGNAKYNAGARTLHWIIAALILGNLASGLLDFAIPVHKAIGMTVLALSVVRLGWRLAWKAPPYPASMSRAEVGAAHGVHALLYLFMVGMPLSGWIFSSAGKYPLTWFGLIELPKLAVTKGSALVSAGRSFHEIGGWLLLALVAGHIAAALRHHFMLKDGVLRRML